MEIDDRNVTRGRSGKRQLRNRVSQLTREDRTASCYVGVTTDCVRRARQHRKRAPHFERMVVLFETEDADEARAVERDLIDHTVAKNENWSLGGEGLRQGHQTYSVYVLLEPAVEETTSPLLVGLGIMAATGLAALVFGSRLSRER